MDSSEQGPIESPGSAMGKRLGEDKPGEPAAGGVDFERSVAEVDLGAIWDNVTLYRSHCPNSEIWAVVKADAYGHGLDRVAITALDAGAGGLCVATVGEAVHLRNALLYYPRRSLRILVLSEPAPRALDDVAHNDLDVTLCSVSAVAAMEAAADRAGRTIRAHVKVDTGMSRMGVVPEELVAVAEAVKNADHLELVALFTHLACADEPENPANSIQLGRFHNVRRALQARGLDPPWHVANSAGAITLGGRAGAIVRLGLAMYGIDPFVGGVSDDQLGLRPAMSIRSQISAIREVDAGQGVSYGHHHVTERVARLATVPIGYGDGLPREYGLRGGEVLIAGRRSPIRGVVTMDQTIVELASHQQVEVGDEVVIIGRQGNESIGATEVAGRLATIPWTVVTGFRSRLERRYIDPQGSTVPRAHEQRRIGG